MGDLMKEIGRGYIRDRLDELQEHLVSTNVALDNLEEALIPILRKKPPVDKMPEEVNTKPVSPCVLAETIDLLHTNVSDLKARIIAITDSVLL